MIQKRSKIRLKLDPKQLKNHTRKIVAKIFEEYCQTGPKTTRLSRRVLPQNPPLEPKVVQGKPQGHKISKNVHFNHQKTLK